MAVKTLKAVLPSPDHGAKEALIKAEGGPTLTHDALAANANEIAAQLRRYRGRKFGLAPEDVFKFVTFGLITARAFRFASRLTPVLPPLASPSIM